MGYIRKTGKKEEEASKECNELQSKIHMTLGFIPCHWSLTEIVDAFHNYQKYPPRLKPTFVMLSRKPYKNNWNVEYKCIESKEGIFFSFLS